MPPVRKRPASRFLLLLLASLAILACAGGCGRERDLAASSAGTAPGAPTEATNFFTSSAVGAPVVDHPWIAHVNAVDLDRDGRLDILACESQLGQVVWLRQTSPGRFTETAVAPKMPAPVHVEAVDFDADGDVDLLVACMGQVFPNNDKIGSLQLLENDGHQHFTAHALLENVARVTDARAADFNGDGRLDIVVGQFGYSEGEIRWLRNLGGGKFASEILLDLPGTVNVVVADFNGDKHPDFAALVAQQFEEVVLFTNDGAGHFTRKNIFGSTNEDFGSSGLVLCDLNRDGRPDLLYANGDGFDYAEPGARPWHGVQWLENPGNSGGEFKLHRIGDLPGAYAPVAADFDGDGDLDVVAVSGFNDWSNPRSASITLFENDGQMHFAPRIVAHAPTHLLTTAAGDFDANGRPVLVTGGFHAYPPWDRMSRLTLWRSKRK